LVSVQIQELQDFLKEKGVDELWTLYGLIGTELKERGEIRTSNLTSERGEAVAIDVYNRTSGEPKLQLAPIGTKCVDALSREGKRYSIKTLKRSRTTSTFQADDFSEKRFDYLILVVLDDYYQPQAVLEAPWESINRHKRYHKTMKAFNVSLTNKLREECRLVYSK